MNTVRCAALITGAGSSSRMGTGQKKEYRILDGIPVLAHSLRSFQNESFAPIVLTIPAGQAEIVRKLIAPHCSLENLVIVEGGPTRRDSVHRGLSALKEFHPTYVLIHDAARPWLTPELIAAVLAGTKKYGACIPVVESRDALVELDLQGFVASHLSKKNIRGVQTPQGFLFDEILNAHETAKDILPEPYDDAQLLRACGKRVFTVPGNPANKKITYTEDLEE